MKFVSLSSQLFFVGMLVITVFGSKQNYAGDEEYCTDYVIVSIAQYWQSVDDHCAFTGSRWSSDYKGQYDWCMTAHQWVADNETEARDRMLEECRVSVAEKQPTSTTQGVDVDADSTRGTEPAVDSQARDEEGVEGARNEKNEENKIGSDDHKLGKALLYAIAENDVEKVQKLVDEGADIHYLTQDLTIINELGMAYHPGTSETKGNIVVTGNPANNEFQTNQTKSESMLSYAVSKGLVDVGLWLLEQEAGTLDENNFQQLKNDLLGRALINAVKNKKMDTVTSLIEKGAPLDYDLEMNFGTPLYFAVTQGATKIAKVLLAQGANSNYTTNGGQNMMNYSVDNIELLTLLLDYGADPNDNGESPYSNNLPLAHAIKLGNVAAVEVLLKHGAKTDIYDVQEPYPLLQAIAEGHVKIVDMLIQSGADVNVVYNPDSSKGCSLSVENTDGDAESTDAAAKSVKNTEDAQHKNSLTPLGEAIKTGNGAMVALLRKAGAKTEKEICL